MRDPARIDKVIGALRSLWHLNPDLRLGQLVVNLTTGVDAFNVEDDEVYDHITAAINNHWPTANEKKCAEHGDVLVFERGGPDMPSIAGRLYCPTCQQKFMEALDDDEFVWCERCSTRRARGDCDHVR